MDQIHCVVLVSLTSTASISSPYRSELSFYRVDTLTGCELFDDGVSVYVLKIDNPD